jgi:hypothetical protein
MPFGFRRPFRRLGPALFPTLFGGGALLPMRPRRILRNANMLFESGQFSEAAPILENLANLSRQQGIPRAPFLFVRAARAFIFAGQPQRGVQLFQTAFEILASVGGAALLFPAAHRLIEELTELGHPKEAAGIREIVLGAPGWDATPSPAPHQSPLPTHCPNCGAGIRSDEVQWIDESTAECTYCGSPIR